MLQYESITTNDNTTIAYQTSVPTAAAQGGSAEADPTTAPIHNSITSCILLLHGFSGSSAYFKRNVNELSEKHWVITPDMRGHGRSQHTTHGYHVARLAMDLKELVDRVIRAHDSSVKIYAVGCSIGAAVLWTYVELFTDNDFTGLVFVDQGPLQDRSSFGGWGQGLAHYGCYDEATTFEAQKCWASGDPHTLQETYVGLINGCFGYRYAPSPDDNVTKAQKKEDEEFFASISRTCDGVWLAKLLTDHTRYDHREAIELISKPTLVMAGRRSGCFSLDGMMETARRAEVNKARSAGTVQRVVFESGHWMFWEEPDKFNQEILNFVGYY